MKKQEQKIQLIAFLAVLPALIALVLIVVFVLQANRDPLAVATASVEITPEASLSETLSPDYIATREILKTQFPEITAVRPTGIFDAGAEFFHEGYRMQNAWQNQVNGFWASVVAGARQSDPEQGVIFTAWEFPNAAIWQFMNTPTKAGSVKISSEENYRLTLEATDGTIFYFDIPSQSFVNSLTEPIPTITPPPTYTPIPPTQPISLTGYPLLTPIGYPEPVTTPSAP